MEPRQRPLDVPTGLPQAAAVGRPSLRQHRPDPPLPQPLAILLRVVRPVTLDSLRAAPRPTPRALDRRDRVDQREQMRRVMPPRPRQPGRPGGPPRAGGPGGLSPPLSAGGGGRGRGRAPPPRAGG